MPDVKTIDFDFALANLVSNFYFKAYYVFISVYCAIFKRFKIIIGRSQSPHGLRRRSAAACLLRLWVRIPPGAWMFVYFVCCVLSGRGLCDELITRPEEL